jgi:hypothetical protein
VELERIADAAERFAAPGERLSGVLATEPVPGLRIYLCAFESADGRAWLVLDEAGEPVDSRSLVRDAASIAALVELAADAAGGGQLDELRSQLVSLRLRENPPGIDEAEEAALALEHVVGAPPRLATPALVDEIGAATRRLEVALGTSGGSPFAEAMKAGTATVEALVAEIEAQYKAPLG